MIDTINHTLSVSSPTVKGGSDWLSDLGWLGEVSRRGGTPVAGEGGRERGVGHTDTLAPSTPENQKDSFHLHKWRGHDDLSCHEASNIVTPDDVRRLKAAMGRNEDGGKI